MFSKIQIRLSGIFLMALCIPLLAEDEITNKHLEIFVVKPIANEMILPNTYPIPNIVSNSINITATPGEYESVSIVLRAKENTNSIVIKATHLIGVDTVIIPSENIDIKYVKCWYQATTAWHGIHTRPKEGKKVLVPELLLKDDQLINVDYKEKKNYLRMPYHSRGSYKWISDPKEPDGDKMKVLTVNEYPISDSRDLMPVDLLQNKNKQLWITVKVPEQVQEGLYKGNLNILSNNRKLASLPIKLKVLPFKLDDPKCYYNLKQDFVSSIYYRGKFHNKYPNGSISSEYKSKSQLKAELQDMFNHGIFNPTCYQGFDKELLAEYLKIRNEIGMKGMPLYYLGVSANSSPETIKKVLEFVKSYGINEVYFYGIDEASGERLKSQRKVWKENRKAGGKIFVAGGKNRNFEAMGDIQDLHICAGVPTKEEAKKWHSVGHKVFCYANPQGGPENPEMWRRNYGLGLWKANYDGACTYCYQHSFGNIFNDFDHYHYRDHVVAYPTIDGVIDTLALEGYREAIDDIRYATTLRNKVEKAKRVNSKELNNKAKDAEVWLSSIDVASEDLDELRKKMIEYIIELN